MSPPRFVPLENFQEYPLEVMLERARRFREDLQRRRSLRQFSTRPVPRPVIEECLRAAGSAPSGANLQPWTFVVVQDPETKAAIRRAAESEEHEFYHRRATKEWLEALEPLGTDEHKPYLEAAPYLIAVFALTHSRLPGGRRIKNYYISESVGIATGILITALHLSGLACLTHTPSPMAFLNTILGRPRHERPYLLLVVGFPAEDARVPVIRKKPLHEFVVFQGKPPVEGSQV